jgi:hypothetical protein
MGSAIMIDGLAGSGVATSSEGPLADLAAPVMRPVTHPDPAARRPIGRLLGSLSSARVSRAAATDDAAHGVAPVNPAALIGVS